MNTNPTKAVNSVNATATLESPTSDTSPSSRPEAGPLQPCPDRLQSPPDHIKTTPPETPPATGLITLLNEPVEPLDTVAGQMDESGGLPGGISETEKLSIKVPSVGSTAIKKKKSVIRCGICTEKLGLCVIKCRCGVGFCSKHRPHQVHRCPFDYFADHRSRMKKTLKEVVPQKIARF